MWSPVRISGHVGCRRYRRYTWGICVWSRDVVVAVVVVVLFCSFVVVLTVIQLKVPRDVDVSKLVQNIELYIFCVRIFAIFRNKFL